MQPISRNMRQRPIIQHHNRIRILRQPPHRKDTVVRVHHHITRVRRIREHGIRLDNLLGEPIVEPLQEEAAQAGARAARNGVQHHEALEGIAAVGLTVNHLHDVLADSLARLVAVAPVVGGAHAIFADVEVFGVVDVLVGAGLDSVDYLRLSV